ncbi:MAG: hypothetical protein QOE05_3021 [Actinomycetota bacterium]|jgi:CubicO group peptidase (beta-lactamase class C family)|nr:hypothetical protein [Actinomycetota bacterium]
MTTAQDPQVTTARSRLDEIVAVLTGRAELGALTPSLAPPEILSITSPDLLSQVVPGLAHALGDDPDVEPTDEDDRSASAIVSGGGMRLLLRVYVEPTGQRLITDLDVVPFLDAEGATEWSAQPQPPRRRSTTGGDDERLESWLTDVRERHHLVGVAAACMRGGEVVWSQGLGWADLEAGTPVDPDRGVFRIGSASKTMTTVSVLQLVATGRVDLDGPANDYLNTIRITGDRAAEVTVRHLLTHTAALRELAEETLMVPADRPEPELVDLVGAECPVEGVPGSSWAYSNVGMSIAGQLVADVVGTTFEEHVAKALFAPLSMTDTSFLTTPDLSRVPTGYREGAEAVIAQERVHVGVRPAGSVFASLPDMVRWAQVVFRGLAGADEVLPAELWRDVATEQVAIPMPGVSMGLGFLRGSARGRELLWHNGELPGATTQFWLEPASGTAVMLFSNVWSPRRLVRPERECALLCAGLAAG